MEVKTEDTNEKLFAVLELLYAWLARSGNFPLFLSLTGTEFSFHKHSLLQQFFSDSRALLQALGTCRDPHALHESPPHPLRDAVAA
jgi:hypothetical protein